MWPWKRKTTVPKIEISVVLTRTDDDFRDMLTYLPHKKSFEEGIDGEGIIGSFIDPIENIERPGNIYEEPM